MVAILAIGAVAIVVVVMVTLSVWFPEWFGTPIAASRPSVNRVRRVIGFAIVAAGVGITFLNVTTPVMYEQQVHVACGSVWRAMFSKDYNFADYACGSAAFPHLWIAGGVAAVGMGIAFWGAGRGRLLAAVCLPLVATVLISIAGWAASTQMGGE